MKYADISVIIPTYNRALFLPRAIDSVLKQSLKCAEIIVVDDGSTDDTNVLVDEKRKTSVVPIRFLHQENKGPSAARNHGVSQAISRYISFLDSDDHWDRRKIEKQYSALQGSPKFRISHTWERWLRCGKHLNQKKKHIPRHGDIFNHCLELCAVGMSTVMLEASLFTEIGLFDESMRCCEDYDFWLRVSCRYPFLLVPERLTIKEGGREDQVSYQYRLGMDKLRVDSLLRLLHSGVLNDGQSQLCMEEIVIKSSVYGQGAKKHGQLECACKYLQIAEDIRTRLTPF